MSGRFIKGQSGNPGGRPKALEAIRDLAREHTVEAIDTLVAVMTAKESPPVARVAAAAQLLDRGWGKATQTVTIDKTPLDDLDPETLAALADALQTSADGQEPLDEDEKATRH
jgi:hypothetical protein